MTPSCAVAQGRFTDLPPQYDVASTISYLRAGLPAACFESLSRAVGVREQDLAGLVRIPARTIARRKREGRFPLEEGERILRLIRIYEQTLDLFSDPEAAMRWLNSPSPILEGKTPLAYSDTEPGAQFVRQLLGRLEHGVFS